MLQKKVLLILLCLISEHSLLSHDYPHGDGFREIAHHIFDERISYIDFTQIREGDIFFLNGDAQFLQTFFTDILPHITTHFFLITHNTDNSIPGAWSSMLDDPRIILWFSQNVNLNHPKLIPIPIGIANPKWAHGNSAHFDLVLSQKNKQRKRKHRGLLYSNFDIGTNSTERKPVQDLFTKKKFVTQGKKSDHLNYLYALCRHKFVLSPPGNGLDCHRTWEALIVGTIPIVKSSPMDSIFEGLPVLIISDWQLITEHFLERKFCELNTLTNGTSTAHYKLTMSYWKNLILGFRNQYLKISTTPATI